MSFRGGLKKRLAFVILAVLVCGIGSAFAQTVTGSIFGTVVDVSGGSVPAASVTLINNETGEQRRADSNENGEFVFPVVLPGRYTVSVAKPGFKKVDKTNLNLTASERLSAGQIQLSVGQVTEQITVEAAG